MRPKRVGTRNQRKAARSNPFSNTSKTFAGRSSSVPAYDFGTAMLLRLISPATHVVGHPASASAGDAPTARYSRHRPGRGCPNLRHQPAWAPVPLDSSNEQDAFSQMFHPGDARSIRRLISNRNSGHQRGNPGLGSAARHQPRTAAAVGPAHRRTSSRTPLSPAGAFYGRRFHVAVYAADRVCASPFLLLLSPPSLHSRRCASRKSASIMRIAGLAFCGAALSCAACCSAISA